MTQLNPNLAPTMARTLAALQGQAGTSLTDLWFYVYATNFAAVAQGGTQVQTINVDAGVDFICQGINFSAWFTNGSAPGAATETQKLYRHARDFATELTSAGLQNLTLDIATSDRPWSNIPMQCDLITGEPGELFLLPTSIYIAGSDAIRIALANNLPATVAGTATPAISAQIALVGYKGQRGRR